MKKEDLLLGCTARDLITGFTGVATGVCEYVSGCTQVLLMPSVDGEGKKRDGDWFDIQRVERVGNDFISLDNTATPGFDQLPPKR